MALVPSSLCEGTPALPTRVAEAEAEAEAVAPALGRTIKRRGGRGEEGHHSRTCRLASRVGTGDGCLGAATSTLG